MAGVRAYREDIEMFIGTDRDLTFTVRDADGDPVDVSTWTLSWMLKRRVNDPDSAAFLLKTTAAGITVAGSVATVAIADTDTDAFPARVYRHELKRTDAGLEAVVVYGELELIRGVHRS